MNVLILNEYITFFRLAEDHQISTVNLPCPRLRLKQSRWKKTVSCSKKSENLSRFYLSDYKILRPQFIVFPSLTIIFHGDLHIFCLQIIFYNFQKIFRGFLADSKFQILYVFNTNLILMRNIDFYKQKQFCQKNKNK